MFAFLPKKGRQKDPESRLINMAIGNNRDAGDANIPMVWIHHQRIDSWQAETGH
jgi:hypothetical protein